MRPFLTLHHPAQARDYYREAFWGSDTLFGLLKRHAEERPEAPALQDGRRLLSWADLLAWVEGTSADLARRGLAGGDRVSIWMSNRAEAIVLLLACSRDGLACNPSLHRTHTLAEIAVLLKRLSAKVLLTEPGWGSDRRPDDVDGALTEAASLHTVYMPDAFPSAGPASGEPVNDPDKVVYLAFTSGTTGAPKCVMHSDNTLLANARELVADWSHGPNTVLLSLSPLSHHIAWVAVAQWLVAGCLFVTDDPPQGMSRVDWIERTGATYVMGVPTHAMDILSEQKRRGAARLGKVEVFYMAGAPIPPTVAHAFVLQGIKPQNIYGMTENSSHQYTHPDDDEVTVTTSCGRGGRAYEVKIFDPAEVERALPAGEVGHIGGRGAALMLGYFDNQSATEQSFNADGWFMSGDLGSLDERGNLRIEGRIKDLIIRGGHNIYPVHIEALALRHPQVGRVACFPVADERLGERVCVALLGQITPGDLLSHLADEGLSKFDMPEYFLRLDDFPLTPSGKILKRELVERVRRGDLSPEPIRFRAPERSVA